MLVRSEGVKLIEAINVFSTYFDHMDALWSTTHFINFTSCETHNVNATHAEIQTSGIFALSTTQLQNKVADNVKIFKGTTAWTSLNFIYQTQSG